MGKIFPDKELGEASRWRVAVFSVGCVEEALGTVPLCAFCILGKGCSSQECGIFLWKAVEKGQIGRAIPKMGIPHTVGIRLFPTRTAFHPAWPGRLLILRGAPTPRPCPQAFWSS